MIHPARTAYATLLRDRSKRAKALLQREFYRDEIIAVLALEADGVRCPSTFDGGMYLRECLTTYIAAARLARR